VVALYRNDEGVFLFDQHFTMEPRTVRSENLRELPYFADYTEQIRYGYVEYRYCDYVHGDFNHVVFGQALCTAPNGDTDVDSGRSSNYLTVLSYGTHYTRFSTVENASGYGKYYLLQPGRTPGSKVDLTVYSKTGESLGVALVPGNPLSIFTTDDIFNRAEENNVDKLPYEMRRDYGWFETTCPEEAPCTLCTATVDPLLKKRTGLHCD
jgi:hypothetical protein